MRVRDLSVWLNGFDQRSEIEFHIRDSDTGQHDVIADRYTVAMIDANVDFINVKGNDLVIYVAGERYPEAPENSLPEGLLAGIHVPFDGPSPALKRALYATVGEMIEAATNLCVSLARFGTASDTIAIIMESNFREPLRNLWVNGEISDPAGNKDIEERTFEFVWLTFIEEVWDQTKKHGTIDIKVGRVVKLFDTYIIRNVTENPVCFVILMASLSNPSTIMKIVVDKPNLTVWRSIEIGSVFDMADRYGYISAINLEDPESLGSVTCIGCLRRVPLEEGRNATCKCGRRYDGIGKPINH